MLRKYLLAQGPHRARMARLLAKLIDLLLVLAGTVFFYPMGLLLGIVYLSVSDSLYDGQSIGKRWVGFCVISLVDGTPCSAKQSFVRNLPFTIPMFFMLFPWWGWWFAALLSFGLLGLELYFMFHLESAHRLGDVIADTTVIANDNQRLDIRNRQYRWWDDRVIPMQ